MWADVDKPCKEAFIHPYQELDIRNCTEEWFNENIATPNKQKKWREIGSEHRVLKNGNICRRLEVEDVWVIEIDTLEQLNKFAKKYGEIIVRIYDEVNNDIVGRIEIYDDYRE